MDETKKKTPMSPICMSHWVLDHSLLKKQPFTDALAKLVTDGKVYFI